ncbi:MAG TPA: (5-formylfuran-3-yl)methyl phosphate synthase [Candidatus Bathyarchaeia archaeon]|nr:(5-formylfuran-3-yl)methyl phosphate synthase [Candidatus Bathyarchaeia archaeon]
MKLLISPMNEKEASEAIAGGADIIDVKNPQEGALGANFPWVIKRIREIAPRKIQVSCALGDVPNLPGSISLAALGAASLGVDYIKVGLYGFKTPREAVFLLQNVNKAAKECNPKIKVVATGYADAERISTLDPMLIPEIASLAQVDLAMIDTAVKDGKNIFNFLAVKQLEKFVDEAHKLGLEAALAGSLRKQDLPVVYGLGADVAGLRGAACTNSDRDNGQITRKLVHELVETVKQAEKQANTKRA